ncbi:fibronectin type III domain [Chlorella sorokiniana]|uniref:Fibronectin type III domain n=1 Tax=Chlorella sorokiniana TaxID=3076 RepID=A0A2P6TRM4_CHLSO|nr:fibronectin type III domain [Chlorella sorokiniana]|eukprot:PRW56704.1 fibronectin type III domain [Chlorella sorokiniana]
MARSAAAALLLLLACAGAAHAQLLGSRLLCAGRTPASVTGLKATPGNGQFALAWQPVPCAAAYRLTAQRTDVQNTNTLRFEVAAPGTTAVVNNVANGASYRVTIAACNGDLCSAPAVLAGVVPAPTAAGTVPATPTGPVVQNVNGTAFKIPQKRAPVS